MAIRRKLKRLFSTREAVELISKMIEEKPLLPFLIPLLLFAWSVERWLVPFSNWVPLAAAVWATIQYGRFRRRLLVEDLNKRWERLILYTSPTTPIEPCEWLNKLSMEVWPNFMEPKLSTIFFSIVERRLRNRRPKLIEKIELQEVTLGSCPPNLGQNGVRWITFGDQKVMRLGFDWDTNEMSVMFLAKLAKPLIGTARIVINSIHIKGDLLLIPVLDGQAVLYSFESAPEVRINVAFGSGSSQSLPATELPGVSSWLVKLLSETISRTMVEPRRLCFSLPHVNLRKKAVGGILSVTVKSAKNLRKNTMKNNSSNSQNGSNPATRLQTVIETEIGDLTRKTGISEGTDPVWNGTFNMVLHGESGIIKFSLYELDSSGVKFNYMTRCEIKMKYVKDDSTIFWAIGHRSGVIAKQAEECGQEIEMLVPFEDSNMGELTVSLTVKEWQFFDGSISSGVRSQVLVYGPPSLQSRTGRKLKVTVVEGKNLTVKEKFGKCDPYVNLHYGKAVYRTKSLSHTVNPMWAQQFELDEISGGEYLKIKCYSSDLFGDESIGSARVSLEGISDGSVRDVWVPLEKVSSGEIRLQIEALKTNDEFDGAKNSAGNGWIELVIIEARDLVAADLRGTSDPYVRVHYGNIKKRTKVIYKTLAPQWNQTLEFRDTGSQLSLHVKDHNAVLPTASIGHCSVEYEGLPPNRPSDKWVPLQGVRTGEIHIRVTRRVPSLEGKPEMESIVSPHSKAQKISTQMRDLLKKFQGLVEEGDLDSLSNALSEIESVEDAQEEYMLRLEREKNLLLSKISELGHEISRTSSSPSILPF